MSLHKPFNKDIGWKDSAAVLKNVENISAAHNNIYPSYPQFQSSIENHSVIKNR